MSAWPQQPTGRPSGVRAPSACAASSISVTSSPTAARISSTGAGSPAKSTGHDRRVRGVSAAAPSRRSMFSVAGSMSAKVGVAPR